MRRNLPRLRFVCLALLGVAAIVPSQLRGDSEVEQHLRDQYKGKTLLLRNFYAGDSLRYDASGQLSRSATSGDWTVDGFVRVTSLSLSGRRLTIHAERQSVANGGQSFQFHKSRGDRDPEPNGLRIQVEVDSGAFTAEMAEAALSRIFLTSQDRMAKLVPDYWRPCVLAAANGKGPEQYKACRFSQELAVIPGILSNSEESSEPQDDSDGRSPRIGKGLTPPRVIFHKDPNFSEQARRAKYSGTAMLSLTVDQNGESRNVRIVRPLGMGLDQNAVETISTWRFDPARKDGEPVEMRLMVEVDFHLY